MRSDLEFHYRVFDHLSQQEFVDLCNSLLLRVISQGVIPFGAKGPDAKRDGTFRGKSNYLGLDGFWIFQNKFHSVSEQGIKQARSRVKSELVKELKEVVELYGGEVNTFIFITNITFTAAMYDWFEQEVAAGYHSDTLRHIEYWDGHKVFLFLQQYPELYDRYIRDRAAAIEKKVDELPAQIEQVVRKGIFWERPPTGTPFQAPPLPAHFVPRPEVSDVLKARLLTDETTTSGVLVVSAIHGLGGIGKSILASALAHDQDVQKRFSDGILWATLGQQPGLLSLLSGWVQNLGDYDFRPTTVEATVVHLRTLLYDKVVLLVVDDIWDPEHACPFLVGGPHCRVLITTRRADVADEVGADLYQLDVMTPEQSLMLLSARLRRALERTEWEKALRLAEAVGYLPLALELAAARAARGTPWATLCDALEEEIARLEALEGPGRRRREQPRLEASFNLSLNALRAEDEEAWQSFVWLGVLPEGVTVAAPMAATLWEVDETGASEMLELLWNDALLLPSLPVRAQEGTWLAYRLHGLLHDMARRLLTNDPPQGLGFILPEAHAALLERYRARTQGGLWHTLPDDGYIHAHLTWHMEQVGWADEIHALLCEETAEGRNGWYEARDQLGQTAGYIEDVRRAWNAAVLSGTVYLQIRYALIESTIHSVAQGIPIELLTGLVQYGSSLLSPASVLDLVRQLPRIWQRADALHDLAPYLPEQVLPDALDMALAIAQENERGLLGLAPFLTPDLLEDTLHGLSNSVRETNQAHFLEAATSTMPDRLLDLALVVARQMKSADCRAVALSCLTPRLSGPLLDQVVLEALNAASQPCSYPPFRAKALMYLAPYISSDQIDETWEAPWKVESRTYRDECYVQLAQAYCRSGMVDRVFPLLQQISLDQFRYEAISQIVPQLPKDQLPRMLDCLPLDILRFELPKALGILARYGSADLQGQVLNLARSDRFDNLSRLIALATIAPHLCQPEVQKQVWEEVDEILHQFDGSRPLWHSSKWHLGAYEEVVDCLPADLISRIVHESQEAGSWHMIGLVSLDRLSEPLKRALCSELLAGAREGGLDLGLLTKMLPKLTPYVFAVEREELLSIAVQRARRIEDRSAFDPLAPYRAIISGMWGERPSREYFRERDHVRVLLNMVPYSSQPKRVARIALEALDALKPYFFRFFLCELIPLLPLVEPDQQALLTERILETVVSSTLHDDVWRSDTDIPSVLHLLITSTTGENTKRIVDYILLQARERSSHFERILLLSLIIDYLPEPDRQDALADIVHWCQTNADALTSDFNWPHGSGTKKIILAALGATEDSVTPTETSSSLPDRRALVESLRHAATIESHKLRPKLLIEQATSWAQLPTEEIRQILQEVLPLFAKGDRARFLWDLHAIAPVILKLGGETIMESVVEEVERVMTWWP